MIDDKLLKDVARLGLPMFEPEAEVDVPVTLAEVVRSHDLRLWEGFPALLASAAENYHFAPETLQRHLQDTEDRAIFQQLLRMSVAVYEFFHLSFAWLAPLKEEFTPEDNISVKAWRQALQTNRWPAGQEQSCDPERVKRQFELYYAQRSERDRRSREKLEGFSLEFALSQVFSPKQKELFVKKLNGESMNKTEQEYYSRTVKKKVVALANTELHRLALKLLEH